MLKHRWLFTFTLMVVFLVSGCSSLIPPLVQGWLTVTSVDSVETSGPAEPVEETVPAVNCPETTDGTKLLKVSSNGYCLLYPQAYSVVHANDMQMSILIGGLLNVSDPRLDIIVEEANGRSAAQVADALQFDYTPGPDIVRTTTTIAGQDAVVLDNVPGQEFSRRVVFVFENRLYHLTFLPADPAQGTVYERMAQLYQTVIDSFTLIAVVEPDVNNPATFCPEPVSNEQLLLNECQLPARVAYIHRTCQRRF